MWGLEGVPLLLLLDFGGDAGVVVLVAPGESRNGLLVGPMMGSGLAFTFFGSAVTFIALAVAPGLATFVANGFLVAGCRINDFAVVGVFMVA